MREEDVFVHVHMPCDGFLRLPGEEITRHPDYWDPEKNHYLDLKEE
jgi:hypothetical protein